MSWSDKEFCIKCDRGGTVLPCSSCPLSVHEKCLGFPVKFDETGRFYCPHCVYRKLSEELHLAQERTLLRKKALLNFLNEKSTSEDCRSTSSKEPAWSLDNENHLKGARDPEDTLLEKADQQQDRFAAGCSVSDLQSEDSDGLDYQFVEFVGETDEDIDESAERYEMVNTSNSAPSQPQKKQDVHKPQKSVENHSKDDCSLDPFVMEKEGEEIFVEADKVDDDARTAQETVGNIERTKKVEEQVLKTVALPQGDFAVQGDVLKKRRSKAKQSSRTESDTELNWKRRKYNDRNSNDDARTAQEIVGNIEGAEVVEEQVQRTIELPQGDLAQGDVLKKRRSKAKRSSRTESEAELNGKRHKYNDKNNNDDARTAQETVSNIEGAEEVEEQVQKTVRLPQGGLAEQGNVLKKRRSKAKRSSRAESETELNGKRHKYNDKNSNEDARTAQETVGNIEGAEEVEEQVERTVALPQSDLAQGNVLKRRKAKRSSRTESETELIGKRRKYNDKNSNDDARTARDTGCNIEGAEEVEEQIHKTVALPQGDLAQGDVLKKRRSKAKHSSRTEFETELNGKCHKYNDKNSNEDARTAQETVGNIEGTKEVEEQVQKTVTLPQGNLAEQGNVLKKRRSEAKRSSRTESETDLNEKRRKYNDKNSIVDARTAQEIVGNIEGAEEVEEQVQRTVALPQVDLAQGNVLKKRRSKAKRSSRTESETESIGKRRQYNDKNGIDDARTSLETVGNIDGAEEVEEQVQRTVALPQGDLAEQGNVLKKRRSKAKHSSRTESETELNGKRHKYNDKNSNDDARTAQETVGDIEGAEEVEEQVQKTVTLPQGDLAVQGNVLKKRRSEAERSSRAESETELNGKHCKYDDKNSSDDAMTAQETVGNIEGAEEVEEQVERTGALPQGDLAHGNVFRKRSSDAKRSSHTESEIKLNGKRHKYNDKNKCSNDDARTAQETVGNIDGAEEVEEHSSCMESETTFNGKRRKYNDKTSNESTDANAAQENVSVKISFEAGSSTHTEAETELDGKRCKHNDKNSNTFTTVNGASHNSASASKTKLISGERRTPLPWTDEEVNMLKEGFGKVFNDKARHISWTKILDYGRRVFDGTRTPTDLKDKWRNLYGRENYSPNRKKL